MTASGRCSRDKVPRFSARIIAETLAGTPFPDHDQRVGPCWRAAYPGWLRPAAIPPPEFESDED